MKLLLINVFFLCTGTTLFSMESSNQKDSKELRKSQSLPTLAVFTYQSMEQEIKATSPKSPHLPLPTKKNHPKKHALERKKIYSFSQLMLKNKKIKSHSDLLNLLKNEPYPLLTPEGITTVGFASFAPLHKATKLEKK